MSMWYKQSSTGPIKLGPFLDEDDGKTAETTLTISPSDVRLSKNDGNYAAKNSNSTGVHDENGWYDIDLDGTDRNTLGRMRIAVHEPGALPVWLDIMIVPANVYDSYFSTGERLQVDVAETSLVVESEGSYTLQQSQSIILAAVAGESTSDGSILKSPNGVATRITATIDSNDNRTGMILNPST